MRRKRPSAAQGDPRRCSQQPRPETVRIAKGVDLAPRGQQRVGKRLLGVVLVPPNQIGPRLDLRSMLTQEDIEGVGVPLTKFRDQRLVGQVRPPSNTHVYST